jgi:RNA polymerase sigma factor (sigma-70 family)
MPQGSGPGVQTVKAAQAGDEQALGDLLSGYLPLIYNIVGRALGGHADVDDVVQETMLRAVRGLADLRDPAAFRSWLVAVAIRQARDHHRARLARPRVDLTDDVADPGADFAELTILRLGLSGQRRETAQAARWLEPSDQELLALWWLEAGGQLDRNDIVAAVGVPAQHAAVRIARMKEQLTTARVVVRAVSAEPPCWALAAATADWDRVPSPLWRKRIIRHVRDCAGCAAHYEGLIPAERLLAGLTLVALPAGAHWPLPSLIGPAGGGSRILAKAASVSVRAKLVAGSVAASCAVAGGFAAVHAHHGHPAVHPARPTPVAAVLARPAPPTVRPSASARRVPPPPANAKKGVTAWVFGGVSRALAESGASWYYTWSSDHPGIASPARVHFVPMIWGARSVTAPTLSRVSHEGHYLLGFNEPDLSSQSNMTVGQALSLWPQLMATGMRLGSPAVAAGAATPGGWLDTFMKGAAARGDRVNFITLHWYGTDFATGPAVSQLESYLQATYARYHLPIWLTEFALARFGASPSFPAEGQQAAFLTAATAMLQRLPYVARYAWFALPVTATDGSTGLFRAGGVATPVGRAFEAVGVRR